MRINAVVFDIGGVLEYTPDLGITAAWEQRLHLEPGELNQRTGAIWREGSLGTISLDTVHTRLRDALNLSAEQLTALMDDIWREYVGTPNTELMDYFRALRPTYRTAILSNSFVGAREKEEACYGFSQMCEFIIYSHEVGLRKPDPQIYALTCERLDLPPEAVIFVDDKPANIDAANAFGMHGVLIQDNPQVIATIETTLRDNK